MKSGTFKIFFLIGSMRTTARAPKCLVIFTKGTKKVPLINCRFSALWRYCLHYWITLKCTVPANRNAFATHNLLICIWMRKLPSTLLEFFCNSFNNLKSINNSPAKVTVMQRGRSNNDMFIKNHRQILLGYRVSGGQGFFR